MELRASNHNKTWWTHWLLARSVLFPSAPSAIVATTILMQKTGLGNTLSSELFAKYFKTSLMKVGINILGKPCISWQIMMPRHHNNSNIRSARKAYFSFYKTFTFWGITANLPKDKLKWIPPNLSPRIRSSTRSSKIPTSTWSSSKIAVSLRISSLDRSFTPFMKKPSLLSKSLRKLILNAKPGWQNKLYVILHRIQRVRRAKIEWNLSRIKFRLAASLVVSQSLSWPQNLKMMQYLKPRIRPLVFLTKERTLSTSRIKISRVATNLIQLLPPSSYKIIRHGQATFQGSVSLDSMLLIHCS